MTSRIFRSARLSLRALLIGAVALGVAGCDLDLQNPNAVTQDEVLQDVDGVISLAVGMQDIYAANISDFVQAPALVSDEWGTKSIALLAWTSLLTGENFDDSYGTVEAPWAAAYRVVRIAESLIEATPGVGLSPSFSNAIVALAHLHRGMALGQIYLHYPSGPLALDQDNPPAVDRSVILQEAIDALDDAATAWESVDAAELSGFNTRVKGDDLDMENTIHAMRARYNLFAGNYQAASDAAAAVDPTALSAVTYAGTDQNPIYDLSFDAAYVAGLQSFVDDAEPGDERPAFWLDLAAEPPQSNTDTVLVEFGQYSSPGDPFPLYVPDEMKLIEAEAETRLGDLPRARTLVNEVRTQCSPAVAVPAACLSALPEGSLDTEDELLAQIAYERRYELYSQGLRWEDMRRLDQYIANEPWLDFLPIPEQECLANTSISC